MSPIRDITARPWRLAGVIAAGLLLSARLTGVRSGDGHSSWFLGGLDTGSPAVDLAGDLAAATTLCVAALVLLTSPQGLPSLIRRDAVALGPAAASVFVGGGAMSGAIATAVGGWMLGIEVFVIMTIVYTLCAALVLLTGFGIIVAGIVLYQLIDRATGSGP